MSVKCECPSFRTVAKTSLGALNPHPTNSHKRIIIPSQAVAGKKYIYKNPSVGKPAILCGVSRYVYWVGS